MAVSSVYTVSKTGIEIKHFILYGNLINHYVIINCYSKTRKQPLTKMQGKAAYRRCKVSRPCTSESYVHRAVLIVRLGNDKNETMH
jgi:hypothetical protein